jgi:micrococcal nuclease
MGKMEMTRVGLLSFTFFIKNIHVNGLGRVIPPSPASIFNLCGIKVKLQITMKQTICFLFLLAACTSVIARDGDEPKVKVIAIIDGNTVQILHPDGEQQKIMLHGVDSPDSGQDFAIEAKKLLETLLLNKMVVVVHKGKDRYGNVLAAISTEDATDPSKELILNGLAWTNSSDAELELLKEHARDRAVGLWVEENPTPPWLYRRQQSMLRAKSN